MADIKSEFSPDKSMEIEPESPKSSGENFHVTSSTFTVTRAPNGTRPQLPLPCSTLDQYTNRNANRNMQQNGNGNIQVFK